MGSSHNNSSSVFRGLHYNSGSSSGGNTSGIHFHNQLLHHHHLQQHHSPSQNYASSIVQGVSGSSGSGNQIISTTSSAVSLPAPAPVPGKSSSVKPTDNSRASTSRASGTNLDQMQGLVAKLWFDHNLESSLSSLEKDEHDKRMKDLRKQLEYISDTNWKYMPIEKYIGQI